MLLVANWRMLFCGFFMLETCLKLFFNFSILITFRWFLMFLWFFACEIIWQKLLLFKQLFYNKSIQHQYICDSLIPSVVAPILVQLHCWCQTYIVDVTQFVHKTVQVSIWTKNWVMLKTAPQLLTAYSKTSYYMPKYSYSMTFCW